MERAFPTLGDFDHLFGLVMTTARFYDSDGSPAARDDYLSAIGWYLSGDLDQLRGSTAAAAQVICGLLRTRARADGIGIWELWDRMVRMEGLDALAPPGTASLLPHGQTG